MRRHDANRIGVCHNRFPTARKSLILNGEMSEWLKEHAWKACVGETLPWVRIPLSPPDFARASRELRPGQPFGLAIFVSARQHAKAVSP